MAGQGLGTRLMLAIIDVARSRGLSEITGLMLANNGRMRKPMQSLGFTIGPLPENPSFKLATSAL